MVNISEILIPSQRPLRQQKVTTALKLSCDIQIPYHSTFKWRYFFLLRSLKVKSNGAVEFSIYDFQLVFSSGILQTRLIDKL